MPLRASRPARRLRPRARNDAGQSVVELALVLPVLLAILIGVVQFALVYHARDVATTAAQEGARLAAGEGRTPAEGAARAREVLASGLGGTGREFTVMAWDAGETVVVRAEGDYPLVIPWVTGRSVPVEVEAEAQKEGFRSGP